MTQRDLDRAVARATGEPVDRVRRAGFSLIIVPGPADFRPIHLVGLDVLAGHPITPRSAANRGGFRMKRGDA